MYGQLNELRESIINKVTTNQDLLKFIYYCNTDDKTDILSLPNLTKDQRKSLINTQIFKYKRMPLNSQTDAKCFLSMQFGRVLRNPKDNHWSIPLFAFTIVCPDSISETLNGNRILAIEQCIEDSFSYQIVTNAGYTFIVGSDPETVDTGFQARSITIKFVDYVK